MDNPVRPVPELIAEIVTSVEVKRVVCIDDDFAVGVSVDVVRDLCIAQPAEAGSFNEFTDIDFTDDPDNWRERLRKKWDALGTARRAEIDTHLRSKATPEQLPRVTKLRGLFPTDKCSFAAMSWEDWKKQKAETLELAKAEKTLLLVDQDLSSEGASETEGIKIIADALKTVAEGELVCVLLSSKFSPGQEHDLWNEFAKQNDLEPDRFMLASKERMAEPPVGFAMMVKLALINPLCQKFRKQVTDVIKESIESAIAKVNEINIYELERMVFEASRNEGVWEPDTMFRLFGVYQRAVARGKAKTSEELSKTADRIRAVSAIDTQSAPDRPASWKVRRLEMYEDTEYLNQHFLPTELGDVYEGKGSKKFILLVQPCDLMVRSDGSRKGSVFEAIVVKVVDKAPEKPEGAFRLEFFDPVTGADAFVIFRDAFTVPLDVLDYCSLRTDGKSEIAEADLTPSGVIPSWRHRHVDLKKKAASVATHYTTLVNKMKGQAPKADFTSVAQEFTEFAIGRVFSPHPKKLFGGTVDLANKALQFECKRIRRLCQPWSAALLTQYSQFLSRAAFEHGYGSEYYPPLP